MASCADEQRSAHAHASAAAAPVPSAGLTRGCLTAVVAALGHTPVRGAAADRRRHRRHRAGTAAAARLLHHPQQHRCGRGLSGTAAGTHRRHGRARTQRRGGGVYRHHRLGLRAGAAQPVASAGPALVGRHRAALRRARCCTCWVGWPARMGALRWRQLGGRCCSRRSTWGWALLVGRWSGQYPYPFLDLAALGAASGGAQCGGGGAGLRGPGRAAVADRRADGRAIKHRAEVSTVGRYAYRRRAIRQPTNDRLTSRLRAPTGRATPSPRRDCAAWPHR